MENITWHKIKRKVNIRRKSGLYAVYFKDTLIYIGKSTNLYRRLVEDKTGQHKSMRLVYGYENLTYKVKYTNDLWFEGHLIKRLKPKFNKHHSADRVSRRTDKDRLKVISKYA